MNMIFTKLGGVVHSDLRSKKDLRCKKDMRSNIHMEFFACQTLLVDECRAILAKGIDRHTTYAPMPPHLAKSE